MSGGANPSRRVDHVVAVHRRVRDWVTLQRVHQEPRRRDALLLQAGMELPRLKRRDAPIRVPDGHEHGTRDGVDVGLW